MTMRRSNLCCLWLFMLAGWSSRVVIQALSSSPQPPPAALQNNHSSRRSYLVTGGNKGQGLALCQRILQEHEDTHIFLCSRDVEKGHEAAHSILHHAKDIPNDRITVVQLDVTDEASVQAAFQTVQDTLKKQQQQDDAKLVLSGIISNAGILWGHSFDELVQVNCLGVKRVLDAFCPLLDPNTVGRVIVVSTGLSPLMVSYSQHAKKLLDPISWEQTLQPLLEQCLASTTPSELEQIGFSGGPFAEAVPEFHRYGLAKMFADSYMRYLALKQHAGSIKINSVYPGLVYTDLILAMPKYQGQTLEETKAKTPAQGVEVHMRVLFDKDIETGQFYAMNKAGELKHGNIDKRPDV